MKPNFYNTEASAYDYLSIRAPQHLWQAVLEQAMKDAVDGPALWEFRGVRNADEARRLSLELRHAAEEWIADERNEPRRFVWVCEQLGLEPSAVRRAIQQRKGTTG